MKPRGSKRRKGTVREETDLPLFSPAISRLGEAYLLVEQLLLVEAREKFKEYLRIFPNDVEVTNAYTSLQWLARSQPHTGTAAEQELFDWWRLIEKDGKRYKILDTTLHRHLKKGILQRLITGLATTGKKSLNGVHLGLLYFELQQYAEAIRELRIAVGQRSDSSSLLCPLAEALYRTGKRSSAEVAYGLALLYDPLKCGFEDFSHPAIRTVEKKLESTGMSHELARENLLVQAWLEGVLALPTLPSLTSLQQLIQRVKKDLPQATGLGRLVLVADARAFRWALQVAVWIRDEASHMHDELAWAHRIMRERDTRAFQTFNERMRLEDLQDEETVEVRMGAAEL